jgi:pilus assembly protein CpaB
MRIMTAIGAVVLAVIAGVLVLQYVGGADDRAQGDLELVDVLVASKDIPRGTSGAQVLDGYVENKQFTKASRPPASLEPGDAADIREMFSAATIPAGQPLSSTLFVAEADQGAALGMAEGMQAISVNVDETHGVAGFIAPGDSVNMLLTLDAKNTFSTNPDAVDKTAKLTAFMLPGLKVLAVGQTTTTGADTAPRTDTNGDGKIDDDDRAEGSDATNQVGLITFEVTPRQAEQIAHATFSGTIYLSLNAPGFDVSEFTTPEEIVEMVNLFDQPMTKLDEVMAALDRSAAAAASVD